LSFLELNYPLLQSYDFMVLYEKFGCDVQICGADQWGNAIGGVDLIRRKKNADAFVLSAPLLLAANGKKMGKSEGNAAWVNEDRASAFDYYQFFRDADDALVGRMLLWFTELPLNEIARLSALKDAEINEAKKILALEATKICRGEDAARAAAETAKQAFEHGAAGEGLPRIKVKSPVGIIDAAIAAGLVDSRSEAKRQIAGGGLSLDGAKITDEKMVLDFKGEAVLTLGKKKKVVLTDDRN
jgi:tyrosyl-tRNA synthetase